MNNQHSTLETIDATQLHAVTGGAAANKAAPPKDAKEKKNHRPSGDEVNEAACKALAPLYGGAVGTLAGGPVGGAIGGAAGAFAGELFCGR